MASKIEQLSKLVAKGGEHREVNAMIIYKELNFIENHHLEDYFLVAHRLVSELKSDGDLVIGPGWGRMISSHVCYSLGITSICPISVGVEPILIWGDNKKVPTIDIEVDEESYDLVFRKAIKMFGYRNVARMPVKNDESKDLGNHAWIGIKTNGEKVYLHACALLICLKGIEEHFAVDEVKDEKGNKILCAKEFIDDSNNQEILRFNVLTSYILTRIKGIQQLIEKSGKDYPKMYEKPIEEEDYTLFYQGDLYGVPDFDSHHIQEATKLLMSKSVHDAFNELLNIQGLYILGGGNFLLDGKMVTDYKQKYQHPPFQEQFPYGILFAEDAAWFIHYWTGLSWKQTTQLLQYVLAKDEKKAEALWTYSLHQGRDNGFKNDDIYRILKTLFQRPLIHSKAHYAGRLYLSVYLAGLKNKFPKEFS